MLKVEETELVGVGGAVGGWGQRAWRACAILKVAKTELAPMARQLAV